MIEMLTFLQILMLFLPMSGEYRPLNVLVGRPEPDGHRDQAHEQVS